MKRHPEWFCVVVEVIFGSVVSISLLDTQFQSLWVISQWVSRYFRKAKSPSELGVELWYKYLTLARGKSSWEVGRDLESRGGWGAGPPSLVLAQPESQTPVAGQVSEL